MAAIPKVIHYCWFGGKSLPPLYARCIESWSRVMPDYEINRWDERNTDLSTPYLASCVSKKNWAFASDLVRLSILQTHGGIYLDADVEVVRRFDPLLASGGCFLGYEAPGRATTGVIGAEAGHMFLRACIDLMERRFSGGQPYLIAPEVASAVARSMASDPSLRILEPEVFYPYNPYDTTRHVDTLMYSDVTERTFAIHHWGKSWKQGLFERLLKRIL